jgi:hypothetical protein
MVQIIEGNKKPSFGSRAGAGLERGAQFVSQAAQQYQAQQQMQQENQKVQQLTGMDLSGITDPKQRQEILSSVMQASNQFNLQNQKERGQTDLERLKGSQQAQNQMSLENQRQAGRKGLLNEKQSYLDQILGGGQNQSQMAQNQNTNQQGTPQANGQQFDPLQVSDADIAKLSAIDPNMARNVMHAKDVAIREKRANLDAELKKNETERKFHTGYSKELVKEADKLRDTIPKKEMALNFARDAIETGNLEYFSPDKLADVLGIDLFRTAKGAQLITAGKENLLSNMGRVSARAQNQWFEQRLNSMFPKIGQSDEANLTVEEMLEGELALDKAYLDEFDRLSAEDEKNYGFERKDISKRAHQALKPLEKHILQRTSFRMKEIEEMEGGLGKLKAQVGKKVSKGTPLTMAMAKLYKDKFGDKARKVAEENGYSIPTIEEYKAYQQRPQEFRETLTNE